MIRHRLAAFLTLACSLIAAFPAVISTAVRRTGELIVALFAPMVPLFHFDTPALALDMPGVSADPALLNSMRHEAGMRRLRNG